MQQQFAIIPRWHCRQYFAPQLAQRGKPWTKVAGELFVNLPAQLLGQRRAFSGSGNGDLQVAAFHDGREIKIAVRRIINCVADYIALQCFTIYGRIDIRNISRRNDKKYTVQIARRKFALMPENPRITRQSLQLRFCFWSNHRDSGVRRQQALYFSFRDFSRADDQTLSAFQS